MFLKYSVLMDTLALSVFAQQNGLLVQTSQGPVMGSLAYPTVRQFLGVPYAAADRWKAPSLPPNRSTTLNANQYGDSCMQALSPTAVEYTRLAGFDDSQIFVPQSEDCLTVNIWAPSIDRNQSTAVLLWVHGGGFQFGTSNFPVYNGKNFVRDNDEIILITFNYRLNIFGFPNAPQFKNNTSQSQNFGLLDLDAAVQWVYDNIAAFGGDPEQIVLFGQSAGGIAIDAYTLANPQDKRVKGIIEASGNLAVLPSIEATPINPIPQIPQPWNTIASYVGCGVEANDAQLACMKQVPSSVLENAVIKITSFLPIEDGITIFIDARERAAAGNFLHVPLLSGSTKNEADLIVVAAELTTTGIVVPIVTPNLADMLTTIDFTCPAVVTANNWANAHVPNWRYEYQGIFADISIRSDLRAYHTSENPLVFGTMPAPTNTEVALSKFIQRSWVAFARDPNQGLVNLGWPMYSPYTSTLAQIGNPSNQTGIVFSQGQPLDVSCDATTTSLVTVQQLKTLLGL